MLPSINISTLLPPFVPLTELLVALETAERRHQANEPNMYYFSMAVNATHGLITDYAVLYSEQDMQGR